MKHLKIIALPVMAAAALMAFAGSASATVLTSPAGTEYTSTFTLTATGSQKQEDGFATTTCTSWTLGIKVEANTTVASGKIGTLEVSGCSVTTDVLSKGSLEVKAGGEVRLIGSEWTHFAVGTSCVYGGGTGTKLGTLTGGTPAHLAVAASMPKISGGVLCANPALWTGEFSVTTPKELVVD